MQRLVFVLEDRLLIIRNRIMNIAGNTRVLKMRTQRVSVAHVDDVQMCDIALIIHLSRHQMRVIYFLSVKGCNIPSQTIAGIQTW